MTYFNLYPLIISFKVNEYKHKNNIIDYLPSRRKKSVQLPDETLGLIWIGPFIWSHSCTNDDFNI